MGEGVMHSGRHSLAGCAVAALLAGHGAGSTAAAVTIVSSWEYDQLRPAVASQATTGEFLVAWEDHHWGFGADWDIYARRLGGDGTPAADPFAVSFEGTQKRLTPAIAAHSAAAELLVVWTYEFSATDRDLYARRIGAGDALLGTELAVAIPGDDDTGPAAAFSSGRLEYLVVWERRVGADEFSQHDIYAQRVSATGVLQGGAIAIDTAAADQLAPAVTYNRLSGEYLIVWQEKNAQSGQFDIVGRRLTEDGAVAGGRLLVSTWEYDQLAPRLAFAHSANEFLVVWEDHHWGSGTDWDIYAQRVDAEGALVGAGFPISWEGANRRRNPAVAYSLATDEYLVVWQYEFSAGDHDVYRRRVAVDGTLLDGETPVSSLGSQESHPAVAAGPTSAVAWEDGRGGAALGLDIYAEVVVPPPTPTGTATLTSTASRTGTPTRTATASPTSTGSATPTPSRSVTRTASHTPTATASRTPTATVSQTPAPTASATPSASASPPASATASGTPSATPSVTPAMVEFRGFVSHRPLLDLLPLPGVALSLWGSSAAGVLQQQIGDAVSGPDGFYRLTWTGDPHQFAHYAIAVGDPRWTVVDAIPGPGGHRTPDGRAIEHSQPAAGIHAGNDFIVMPGATPTGTPAAAATPSATPTRSGSATPSATASSTHTAAPSTLTPTATPPAVAIAGVGFGGHVYQGTALRRTPLAGVQVDLHGSDRIDVLGTLLTQAKTGPDGAFYADYFDVGDTGHGFYHLVLSHPNAEVNDVVPAAGGEAREPTRITFSAPPPPAPTGNEWYLAAPPPKLAVKPLEPVPATVVGATVEQIQPIDFRLDGVELTQAIQCFDPSEGDSACADNSLPLVAGKLTAARVYVSRVGPPPATPQFPAVRVDLILQAPAAPIGSVAMAASQQFKVPLAWDRTVAATTANFLIEVPFSGPLLAWAAVNADRKWPDPDPTNNGSAAVAAVVTTRALHIDWLRIDYRPDPSTTLPPFTGPALPSESWVQQDSVRIARWLLPTAALTYGRHGTGIAAYGMDLPVTGAGGKTTLQTFRPDLRDPFTLGGYTAPAMNAFLSAALLSMFATGPDTLFAWFPAGATEGGPADGVAEGAPPIMPAGKGRVALSVEPLARLLAHETAHNLGLGHFPCFLNPKQTHPWPAPYDDCTSVEVAFNPYDVTVNQTFTFMTYGGDSISPPEWTYLVDRLQGGGGGSSAAAPATSSVLVGGWLTEAGDGALAPLYAVPDPPAAPDAPPGAPAELRVLDGADVLLASHPFAPVFEPPDGEAGELAVFHFRLPAPAGMRRLQLRVGNALAGELVASAHAPQVEWGAPAPGALPDGEQTLRWLAGDADGDELSFLLLFSHDGGATWTRLAEHLRAPAFAVDTGQLPGGDECLFRVVASDGLLNGEAVAGPFQVPRKPPQVAIVSPADGVQHPEQDVLVLDGYAVDPEDGPLAGDALAWASDRFGPIAAGATAIVPPLALAPGWHRITAAAADGHGAFGAAAVEIFVRARCGGDCNGDGQVTVDELIRGVNVALGTLALDQCPSFDRAGDERVTIDELIQAVTAALLGCPDGAVPS